MGGPDGAILRCRGAFVGGSRRSTYRDARAETGNAASAGFGRRATAARRYASGRYGAGKARKRIARADRRPAPYRAKEARGHGAARPAVTPDRRLYRRYPDRRCDRYRRAAADPLGARTGVRPSRPPALDRRGHRFCARLWRCRRGRMGIARNYRPGAAQVSGAAARHTRSQRLVRAVGVGLRPGAIAGFRRDRLWHGGDGARPPDADANHPLGTGGGDDRGASDFVPGQGRAAPGR